MCLLTVCPPGTKMHDHEITEAWRSNPDGAGYAHLTKDGKIRSFRSMKLKAFRAAYHQAVKRHPKSPFVVHFRWATHGKTDLGNCHPFAVSDNTVMAHNGVLHIATDGTRSDTRTFAEDWVTALPSTWLDNPVMVALVEDFASGSKLAFLTVEPDLQDNYYILNEDDGHWAGGVWFSNHSYQRTMRTKWSWDDAAWPPKGNKTKAPAMQSAQAFLAALDDGHTLSEAVEHKDLADRDEEGNDARCPFCAQQIDDDFLCTTCEVCLLCGEFFDACNCGAAPVPYNQRHLPL